MDPSMVAGNGYIEIIKMLLDLGPIGLVLILGYFAKLKLEESSTKYETYINTILTQYREHMIEQREMYKNNAELVKNYEGLAGDLRDIIIMNTTAMTKLVERIEKEVCK